MEVKWPPRLFLLAFEWYATFWNLLDNEDAKLVSEHVRPVNYLAFLTMNLLRLCVKDEEAVDVHIKSRTYSSFSTLWVEIPGVKYSIAPHPKTSSLMRCLSALVFTNYTVEPQHQYSVQIILWAGCLLSLLKVSLL